MRAYLLLYFTDDTQPPPLGVHTALRMLHTHLGDQLGDQE